MRFQIVRDEAGTFRADLEAGCQDLLRFDLGPDERIELLGDPVPRDRAVLPGAMLGSDGSVDAAQLYDLVPGHYYWFHWRGAALECGSSFCGILPVYYTRDSGSLEIGSSSFRIARARRMVPDDRGYLLERNLFHYPLFDRTPWKSIRLLPSHSKLRVASDGLSVLPFFDITEHFGKGDASAPDAMERLCQAFGAECHLQMPERGFAISFTGGFDGRTLLGAALKLGRTGFSTYGFGKPGESDIALPAQQAKELGVIYTPVLLDDTYLEKAALHSAIAFMELSDHNGNLGRPHYHYAAEMLSRSHTHLVTGNFGSELFRAMHAPGAMMSEHLINTFGNAPTWQRSLQEAAGTEFKVEAAELIIELETYLARSGGIDPARRFYRFVFEELFRKYFGPEIVMQANYMRNRTPFLSFRFVRTLHDTVWAGVHARLFEKSKVRRIKGQVFYAEYLRRADRRLYRMPTNKGYSPPDLAEGWRLPLLILKFARNRFWPERVDSNQVDAFVRLHGSALARHYGIPASEASKDLQSLSNQVAWNAAKAISYERA